MLYGITPPARRRAVAVRLEALYIIEIPIFPRVQATFQGTCYYIIVLDKSWSTALFRSATPGSKCIMRRALLVALAGAAAALGGVNQAESQTPAATAPPSSQAAPTPTASPAPDATAAATASAAATATAATTAPATTAPAATATAAATAPATAPAAPSPDMLRRAREAGFKPELHNGVTTYCVKDDRADTGTHFSAPKRCYDESQVLAILDQRAQTRDVLRGMSQVNPSSK